MSPQSPEASSQSSSPERSGFFGDLLRLNRASLGLVFSLAPAITGGAILAAWQSADRAMDVYRHVVVDPLARAFSSEEAEPSDIAVAASHATRPAIEEVEPPVDLTRFASFTYTKTKKRLIGMMQRDIPGLTMQTWIAMRNNGMQIVRADDGEVFPETGLPTSGTYYLVPREDLDRVQAAIRLGQSTPPPTVASSKKIKAPALRPPAANDIQPRARYADALLAFGRVQYGARLAAWQAELSPDALIDRLAELVARDEALYATRADWQRMRRLDIPADINADVTAIAREAGYPDLTPHDILDILGRSESAWMVSESAFLDKARRTTDGAERAALIDQHVRWIIGSANDGFHYQTTPGWVEANERRFPELPRIRLTTDRATLVRTLTTVTRRAIDEDWTADQITTAYTAIDERGDLQKTSILALRGWIDTYRSYRAEYGTPAHTALQLAFVDHNAPLIARYTAKASVEHPTDSLANVMQHRISRSYQRRTKTGVVERTIPEQAVSGARDYLERISARLAITAVRGALPTWHTRDAHEHVGTMPAIVGETRVAIVKEVINGRAENTNTEHTPHTPPPSSSNIAELYASIKKTAHLAHFEHADIKKLSRDFCSAYESLRTAESRGHAEKVIRLFRGQVRRRIERLQLALEREQIRMTMSA